MTHGWLYKVNKDGCIDTLNCVLPVSVEFVPTTKVPLIVFPNPAKEYLQIKLPEAVENRKFEAIIYDLAGREMKLIDNYEATQVIDIQELSSGTYWLTLKDGEEIYTVKFVKME